MKQAVEIAQKNIKSGNVAKAKYYDRKVKATEIEIGDDVLLRNHKEKGGTGKLKSHWEKTVYKVVDKDENLPVFSIKPKNSMKPVKRVHRNNLMGCNFLIPEMVPSVIKPRRKEAERPKYPVEVDDSSDDEYVVTRFSEGEIGEEESLQEELVGDPIVQGSVEKENMGNQDSEEGSSTVDGNSEMSDLENVDRNEESGEVSDGNSSSSEEEPMRRSTRTRQRPSKFTYDEIGKPSRSRYQ